MDQAQLYLCISRQSVRYYGHLLPRKELIELWTGPVRGTVSRTDVTYYLYIGSAVNSISLQRQSPFHSWLYE